MIPGSDILNDALSVIIPQQVTYYAYSGSIINDVGQNVPEYAESVIILGSFQPIPRSLYQQLGLNFDKSYFNLYTSTNIIDVSRNVSGDQISFQGSQYQCESCTQWFGIDGWKAVRCILLIS